MSKTPQSAGINVPHIMTRWYCVEYRGRDGKGGKVKPPFPYHSPTVPSLLIGGSHLCTFSHCKILRRFADKISFSVFSSSHTTPGIQSCIPTLQTSHSLFPGFSPPPPPPSPSKTVKITCNIKDTFLSFCQNWPARMVSL